MGNIYVTCSDDLVKLSSDGKVLWTLNIGETMGGFSLTKEDYICLYTKFKVIKIAPDSTVVFSITNNIGHV